MSEQNYIQKIFALRSNVLPDLAGALRIAKQGVAEYPNSAPLLSELGDLIQLAGEETDDLDDALGCYETAAKADPSCGEAHASIGYYHDVHTQDLDAAELAFRKALECGITEDAIVGLARVMAEKGYGRDDIKAILERAPDQSSRSLCQMRSEIESGEWEPHCE
jgi:tetratricopeptide (TPR) repeat protein